MRKMGRAASFACLTALLGIGGCSSKTHDGGAVMAGGGLFGNGPQGNNTGKAGAGNKGTGGSKGSTGTAGTGAGLLADGKCAEGTAHGGHQTPRIVLVIDGSCSMSSNYPGNQEATRCTNNDNGRWAAVRRALIDPQAGVVTSLQGGVEFGLVVFGTQPMCPIPGDPVQPALNNLNAITAALPQVQPGMYTPTGPALDWVYDNMFPDANGGSPDKQVHPQIAILATDGEPNACDNATTNFQPSIDAVTKGAMKGIKTYVISLAEGSGQFHDHLQMLANIGASEKSGSDAALYEPTTPQALEADIQLLVGGAVGCDLPLNGRVLMGHECEGTVELNGQKLKCNDPNGWTLSDDRHVRLQGTACDMLKRSADAMLDARFACDIVSVE